MSAFVECRECGAPLSDWNDDDDAGYCSVHKDQPTPSGPKPEDEQDRIDEAIQGHKFWKPVPKPAPQPTHPLNDKTAHDSGYSSEKSTNTVNQDSQDELREAIRGSIMFPEAEDIEKLIRVVNKQVARELEEIQAACEEDSSEFAFNLANAIEDRVFLLTKDKEGNERTQI